MVSFLQTLTTNPPVICRRGLGSSPNSPRKRGPTWPAVSVKQRRLRVPTWREAEGLATLALRCGRNSGRDLRKMSWGQRDSLDALLCYWSDTTLAVSTNERTHTHAAAAVRFCDIPRSCTRKTLTERNTGPHST